MLSIVIPSRTEKFLDNTIRDVLEKATGEIEIFPVLDGYDCERIDDPRVHYIVMPETTYMKKRHAVHEALKQAKGEYIMCLDAHCMMAKGFDEQLIKDHQPDWVQIPRRNRLDAENWSLQSQVDDRPPIDYEYIMWPLNYNPSALHGFKWDKKTLDNIEKPIDETFNFQGSCWFMTREWFNKCNIFEIEGWQGWGQEAEEIGFKTRLNGGKVITNKNTWYAHLHKGPKYGRMYLMLKNEARASSDFSYNWIVNEHKDLFIETIEKFWPVPGWPSDWKERLWK